MDYNEKTKSLVVAWSNPSISADVREEARKTIMSLADVNFLPPIAQLLAGKQSPNERKTTYLLLESLIRNSRSLEVVEFAVQQIGVEKNKQLKNKLLLAIGSLRGHGIKIKDASNLLACVADKRLATVAITALGCCCDRRAEEALLDLVESLMRTPVVRESAMLFEALASLCEFESKDALPLCVEVINGIEGTEFGLKGHIKAMAIKTLAQADRPESCELYCHVLSHDKSLQAKWHAMKALRQHATEHSIPVIEHRIQSIVSAPRQFVQEDLLFLKTAGAEAEKTELSLGLEALIQRNTLKQKSAVVDQLRKNCEVMTDDERSLLSQVE